MVPVPLLLPWGTFPVWKQLKCRSVATKTQSTLQCFSVLVLWLGYDPFPFCLCLADLQWTDHRLAWAIFEEPDGTEFPLCHNCHLLICCPIFNQECSVEFIVYIVLWYTFVKASKQGSAQNLKLLSYSLYHTKTAFTKTCKQRGLKLQAVAIFLQII